MNTENTTENITQEDIRTFGEELTSFAERLSPQSRRLLAEVLRRASDEGEVSGYYYQPAPTTIAPVTGGGVLVFPGVDLSSFSFGDAVQAVFQVEHHRPLGGQP
jgi:hypothetical protein